MWCSGPCPTPEEQAGPTAPRLLERASWPRPTKRSYAATLFIPAGLRAQKKTADSILATRAVSADLDLDVQVRHLTSIANLISSLQGGIDDLRARIAERVEHDDPVAACADCRDRLIPAMANLREPADKLEALVADDLWPLPKYRELLTIA